MAQPFRRTKWRRWPAIGKSLVGFLRDWRRFRAAGGDAHFHDLSPMFEDRTPSTQSGGGHYFFQDIWALRWVAEARPSRHVDIGSRIDGFVGQATAICPVTYVDIRPPLFALSNLEFCQGSILQLPFADNSIGSLSSLHVVEHIGLGRYGDSLDPAGPEKALKELQRVLRASGQLLFSMPVGKQRTEFNAQRIWNPLRPIELMNELSLVDFAAVNDAGEFISNILPHDIEGARYACGLYRFTKTIK